MHLNTQQHKQLITCWTVSMLEIQTSVHCGERGSAPARHSALASAWREGHLHRSSPCLPGSPHTDARWGSC